MTTPNDTPTAYTPINDFGKDHWSTFAYIETRFVDHGGTVLRGHMRTDPDIHPAHAHPGCHSHKRYPTRLSPDPVTGAARELEHHDDWSCAEDLENAGLLEWLGTGINPVFRLTPEGRNVAARLRHHRASGGSFADFHP